ncbi:MAG TPA: MBL fold metallo-hydrolase [Chloroflexota bacterium]|nr:MBL fold metallo-hydrolase [Chloroflexota bacterium]
MNPPSTPDPDLVVEVPNGGWDPRLRLFRAAGEVDTTVLITNRYVVLIDTMCTPAQAAAIMTHVAGELPGRQLLVINSHADYDHCWGNAVFASPGGAYPAPILGTQAAYERLVGPECAASLAKRQAEEPRFASVRLVPPTISFAGELRLDCGDLTLRLIPALGHSPDQIVVWIPEWRVLLATDAAEHPIPYVGNPATVQQLRRTLQDLVDLRPEIVIPCHGGPSAPDLLTRNLAYFDAVEERVRAALAAGRVTAAMADRDDLPELIGMPLAEMAAIAGIDPTTVSDFYRASHLLAVRALVLHCLLCGG